jgi:hypothetical protein
VLEKKRFRGARCCTISRQESVRRIDGGVKSIGKPELNKGRMNLACQVQREEHPDIAARKFRGKGASHSNMMRRFFCSMFKFSMLKNKSTKPRNSNLEPIGEISWQSPIIMM